MKPILASLVLFASLTGLAAQAARDLVEFTLFKRPEPTKVGDVSLVLKGTDANKQRYNIELTFPDGHKIEKKDQDIRIPIFLYIGADTTPHELVVTKVLQDQIVGRLLSPLH